MGKRQHDTSKRWQEITQIWKDNRWLYIISGILFGILLTPAIGLLLSDFGGLANNLVPEAVGIIFTVLILDRLSANRSREDLKARLFNELRSSAVGQGTAALAWLKRENWIAADSLIGAELHRVNWENAFIGDLNLEQANLNGAILINVSNQITERDGKRIESPIKLNNATLQYAHLDEAVLIGADLRNAQLTHASLKNAVLIHAQLAGANLREANLQGAKMDGAILPDGSTWSNGIDMTRFTQPDHPDFWQAN